MASKIMQLALCAAIAVAQVACNGDDGAKTREENAPPPPSTGSTTEDTSFKGFEGITVVKVALKNTGEYCSGTLVAEDAVITARHCFYNEKTGVKEHEPASVSVREKGGKMSKAYGVAAHSATPNIHDYEDIAVIKLSEKIPNASLIKIAERANEAVALPVGTEVYAFGFSSNSWSKRQITALDPAYGVPINILSKWVIPTSAQPEMIGGDSGGPLVIKQDGKWLLLGALQGKKPYSLELAAITFNAVQAFMPEITLLLGAPLPVERLK